jgi:hypothetical protein
MQRAILAVLSLVYIVSQYLQYKAQVLQASIQALYLVVLLVFISSFGMGGIFVVAAMVIKAMDASIKIALFILLRFKLGKAQR